MPGKYAGFGNDVAGFVHVCGQLDRKEIRPCEVKRAYKEGRILFAPSTVERYVYGHRRTTAAGVTEWIIEPKKYLTLTPDTKADQRDQHMLLPRASEIMMVRILIRLCRRNNGLNEMEIKQWARAQVRCR